jgi:hypothetical protein
MDGFAASGRIERVKPRFVASRAAATWPVEVRADRKRPDRGWGRGGVPEPDSDSAAVVDLQVAEPLGDRIAAFRDRWSALTFYLFDPQSWR